jgi:hypothetical protein
MPLDYSEHSINYSDGGTHRTLCQRTLIKLNGTKEGSTRGKIKKPKEFFGFLLKTPNGGESI